MGSIPYGCLITGPKKCPLVPKDPSSKPSNGRLRKIGTIVTYSCKPRYSIIVGGDDSIECLTDGTWSSSEPLKCEKGM